MSKIRVLIVDDSPFIHKAISRALANGDYEVCGIGSNGKEGAELYAKLKPDLVTMDITMPIMDGIEAVRLIIQQELQARIIMVTAMGQKDIIMSALSAGASDFIVKPFEVRQVVEVVNKQLRHMGQ